MYLSIKDRYCLFLFRINHKNLKLTNKKKINSLITSNISSIDEPVYSEIQCFVFSLWE